MLLPPLFHICSRISETGLILCSPVWAYRSKKKSCMSLWSGRLYPTAVNQTQVDELPPSYVCLPANLSFTLPFFSSLSVSFISSAWYTALSVQNIIKIRKKEKKERHTSNVAYFKCKKRNTQGNMFTDNYRQGGTHSQQYRHFIIGRLRKENGRLSDRIWCLSVQKLQWHGTSVWSPIHLTEKNPLRGKCRPLESYLCSLYITLPLQLP